IPLPLGEFVDLLDRGDLPADAVAITCDDGYANNLLIAKPVLDRFAVPATIFLATGSLGADEFWWDHLESIVCGPRSLPGIVKLHVGHSVIIVPMDGPKTDALMRIHCHLCDLEPVVRDAAIDGLAESLTPGHPFNRSRPLTEDEVRALATGTT